MQSKNLCLLDKHGARIVVAELPATVTAIAYSRVVKDVMFCDPEGEYIGRVSVGDGSVKRWFSRADLGKPSGLCQSGNGTLMYVKTDNEPYFWRFTTENPSASMRVLGTSGSNAYLDLNRSGAMEQDKPNGLCFMNNSVYWASRDRHRIIQATTNSWIKVAYGSGRKGFSMTNNPQVSSLDSPCGLCSDGNRMFVSDTGNGVVRELNGNMMCVAVFGKPGAAKAVDGPRSVAILSKPLDICCDSERVVFVDDGILLRQITRLSGEISTIYSSSSRIGGVTRSPAGVYFVEDTI